MLVSIHIERPTVNQISPKPQIANQQGPDHVQTEGPDKSPLQNAILSPTWL